MENKHIQNYQNENTNNKNRKIYDNIIEMPFLCFKAGLEMQSFFINKVIA